MFVSEMTPQAAVFAGCCFAERYCLPVFVIRVMRGSVPQQRSSRRPSYNIANTSWDLLNIWPREI